MTKDEALDLYLEAERCFPSLAKPGRSFSKSALWATMVARRRLIEWLELRPEAPEELQSELEAAITDARQFFCRCRDILAERIEEFGSVPVDELRRLRTQVLAMPNAPENTCRR